ncbi:MAG: response regulator receiver sensor signal transduction histidine kinase [Chitinophagaceae bacterium]|nr:response regulator receiver sensor signal transduction histidine kinase [Chitinophagaceae bacterium]
MEEVIVKRILLTNKGINENKVFKKMLQETNLELKIDYANDSINESEIIKEGDYDCIFLDYKVKNYAAILDEAKQINLSTPIITLISQKDKGDMNSLMEKGETFFLNKDYLSSSVLKTSIMNAIRVKGIQNAEIEAKEALLEIQKNTHIGNWTYNLKTKTFSFSDEAISILKCYSGISLYSFCRKIDPFDFNLFKNTIRSIDSKYSEERLTVCYSTWAASKLFLEIKIVSTNNGARGTIQDITRLKNALLSTEMISQKSIATKISLIACASMLLIIEAIVVSFVDSIAISLLIATLSITIMAVILKPLVKLVEQALLNRVYCYYKEKVIGIIVGLKELSRHTSSMVLL